MIIDWTITLGNIVEIAGIVGGGVLFLWRVSSTFGLVAYRIGHIEKQTEAHANQLNSIATSMVAIAVQSERITNLSKRIDVLMSK